MVCRKYGRPRTSDGGHYAAEQEISQHDAKLRGTLEIMKEFVVRMEGGRGRLAALAQLLGAAGVNIEALTGYSHDGTGTLRIIVDDAVATKRVLRESAIGFTEHAVLTTNMPHRPGELGRITGALAEADIGIDAIYILRTDANGIEVAIAVEDPEAAYEILPVQGSV